MKSILNIIHTWRINGDTTESTHEIEVITENFNTIYNWKSILYYPKNGQFKDEFVNHKYTYLILSFIKVYTSIQNHISNIILIPISIPNIKSNIKTNS